MSKPCKFCDKPSETGCCDECRGDIKASRKASAVPVDHRVYAIRQLQIAIEKDADAPASAAMHERQALMALRLERVPHPHETLDSWKEESGPVDLREALKTLSEQWREQFREMEAREQQRVDEGTMYHTLSQHFASTLATLRTCADELDAALARAEQESEAQQHDRSCKRFTPPTIKMFPGDVVYDPALPCTCQPETPQDPSNDKEENG